MLIGLSRKTGNINAVRNWGCIAVVLGRDLAPEPTKPNFDGRADATYGKVAQLSSMGKKWFRSGVLFSGSLAKSSQILSLTASGA